jgi:hypothetical protein
VDCGVEDLPSTDRRKLLLYWIIGAWHG